MATPITGSNKTIVDWLKASNIVKDGELVRRVVIDIDVEKVVTVDVYHYVDCQSFVDNFPNVELGVVHHKPGLFARWWYRLFGPYGIGDRK